MWSSTVYTLGSTQIDQVALEAVQALFDPTYGVSAWYGGHGGTFQVGPVIQVAIQVGLFVLGAKGIASQRHEVQLAHESVGVRQGYRLPATEV